MKQPTLMIVLIMLAIQGLACSMSAGVEEAGAMTPSALPAAATATVPPATPMQEPAAQPTGVGGVNPGLGATFSDPVMGIAFDYPAGWYVNGEQGPVVYLTSFQLQEPGGGGLPEGATKIDFLPWDRPEPAPQTLDEFLTLINQERANDPSAGRLVEEALWELLGGIPAARHTYEDVIMAGRVAALYTVINRKPLRVIGYGDLRRFDEIARTVRPVEQAGQGGDSAAPAGVDYSSPQGYLSFEFLYGDAGNFSMLAGSQNFMVWEGFPTGAARYEFVIQNYQGSGEDEVIGIDTTPESGVTTDWLVPERVSGTLAGYAYFADGSIIPSHVAGAEYSGEAPPQGVCSVQSSNIAPVPIYGAPDQNTAQIAEMYPGAYAQVLGRYGESW